MFYSINSIDLNHIFWSTMKSLSRQWIIIQSKLFSKQINQFHKQFVAIITLFLWIISNIEFQILYRTTRSTHSSRRVKTRQIQQSSIKQIRNHDKVMQSRLFSKQINQFHKQFVAIIILFLWIIFNIELQIFYRTTRSTHSFRRVKTRQIRQSSIKQIRNHDKVMQSKLFSKQINQFHKQFAAIITLFLWIVFNIEFQILYRTTCSIHSFRFVRTRQTRQSSIKQIRSHDKIMSWNISSHLSLYQTMSRMMKQSNMTIQKMKLKISTCSTTKTVNETILSRISILWMKNKRLIMIHFQTSIILMTSIRLEMMIMWATITKKQKNLKLNCSKKFIIELKHSKVSKRLIWSRYQIE